MTEGALQTGVYRFEAIDATLPFVPLAARRVLDAAGRKLSLEGWLSLPLEQRMRLVREGCADRVTPAAAALIDGAVPAASAQSPMAEPDSSAAPAAVAVALGPSRPLDPTRWRSLGGLGRYVLAKCASNAEKLARAYDEIVKGPQFAHLTEAGEARMVDVGGKEPTARRATATAWVRTTRDVIRGISEGHLAKGDVLAAARIAGLLAAKRTAELIPLCHPVQTTWATIDFTPDAELGELHVRATVEAIDRTGVEMEAMVAASVASLTVYDMIKSADRWASIEAVRLESKSGGKSGDVTRPGERAP